MDLQANQAIIALIATVFGGAGLKVIEHWLSRSTRNDTTAADMRTELRTEVQSLRDELRKVEDELDQWREKYFKLMEQFLTIKTDLEVALNQIKANASAAQTTLGQTGPPTP